MASVQKKNRCFFHARRNPGFLYVFLGGGADMGNRIKGITVEIGGDTTGLDKALRGVNSSITKTQSALNDVNKLLKLDPSNTVLVAQKQQLLSQAVSQTSDKLEALESAQEQVTAAFQRGDIGQDKYQAFQREIEETRGKLNQYKNDLSSLQTEQDRLSSNTARLEKLFSSTGTQVDDYADVLGSKLVSAIKNGTANSDQMKTAIEKIGKSATGGKADIRQLTDALDTVDDGEAITIVCHRTEIYDSICIKRTGFSFCVQTDTDSSRNSLWYTIFKFCTSPFFLFCQLCRMNIFQIKLYFISHCYTSNSYNTSYNFSDLIYVSVLL